MWNWPDEMAANNLYTFSPSKGNLPVVKWNLETQQPHVTGILLVVEALPTFMSLKTKTDPQQLRLAQN